MQSKIQQLLVEKNGIPEEEKRRVTSDHKSQYQHPIILDNKKKRKREKLSLENSKETILKKRKLSFLSCKKCFKIR